MTKKEAIAMFGSTKELAAAMGISVQAVGQWPDELDEYRMDRVLGAAVRTNKYQPKPAA